MWPNPRETADLVTVTEEILNSKLHFLCSVVSPLTVSRWLGSIKEFDSNFQSGILNKSFEERSLE